MKIPAHWWISALVALPGALLYRAVDSNWFDAGTGVLRLILMVAALTLAFGGIALFIMLSHRSRMK